MKKIDVIEKMAQVRGISKKEAGEIVESFLEIVKNGIKEDGEVDFFGFLKLSKVHKDACEKRNPRTGEMGHVDAKFVPKAKFSSAFKRELLD